MSIYPSSVSKRKQHGRADASRATGDVAYPGFNKPSRACQAVLRIFEAQPEEPLSAREIHHRLLETPSRPNLSTVYRNLARLERAKIVIGLPIPPGDDRSRRYRLA